jgi:hypothetical protein
MKPVLLQIYPRKQNKYPELVNGETDNGISILWGPFQLEKGMIWINV